MRNFHLLRYLVCFLLVAGSAIPASPAHATLRDDFGRFGNQLRDDFGRFASTVRDLFGQVVQGPSGLK